MKKQKRYTTRKQITDAIDAAHDQLEKTITAANAEDAAAKLNAREGANSKSASDQAYYEEQSRYYITERQRLFKRADRIEKIKIPRLGKTLAAFDTQPMGAEGLNDEAVVLSK